MGISQIIGFVVTALIYGALSYYMGRRLFVWLKYIFPRINRVVFAAVFSAVFALAGIGMLQQQSSVRGVPGVFGAYSMGVYIYLLVFLVLADIVLLILRLLGLPNRSKARFYAVTAAVLCAACLSGYGIYNGSQVRTVTYNIETKAAAEPAIKIALVSDLHLGAVGSEPRLGRVAQAVNSLEPDVVCLAGDIFDDEYIDINDPQMVSEQLESIDSKYGVYGCLGNHDSGSSFPEMMELLEQSGVIMLNDSHVVVAGRMVLVGRLNSAHKGRDESLTRQDSAEVMSTVSEIAYPVVVMEHTPVHTGEYDESADLIVSGHTHGGQVFPANLITDMLFDVDYGYYKYRDGPQVVVTSGAGTWGMPMRIGTNNEVVEIILR